MTDLQQMLQSKRDWLASTTGAKKAPASLTLSDLDRIISALQQCENPSPKVSMEPRGTKRSPEEIAKIMAKMYGQNFVHQTRKPLHTCA